jgi:uncharacterized protein YdaU (DUF1376 family)
VSKNTSWMPLFIGDFISDTAHLSMEQSGAYLHLLMYQWRRGSAPADPMELARICRCTRTHWLRKIAPSLLPFFTEADGRLMQMRLHAERERAQKTSDERSFSADKKWKKYRAKATDNSDVADAKASVLHMPGIGELELQRKKEDPKATPSTHAAAPQRAVDLVDPAGGALSARDIVWRHGPSMIAFLTGKSDRQSRGILGKMLSITGDDCSGVMRILEYARSLHPLASAEAHLIACAQQRSADGRSGKPAARRAPGDVSEWTSVLPGFAQDDAPSHPDIEARAESVA